MRERQLGNPEKWKTLCSIACVVILRALIRSSDLLYKVHLRQLCKWPHLNSSQRIIITPQHSIIDTVSLSNTHSHHFKMKFLLLITAVFTGSAFALPEPVSGDATLLGRDNVKLNQYRTLDDW